MEPQLIFVYNANADLFSKLTDFAHKILAPASYNCNLCALTYGSFSEKQEWKSFIGNLPVEANFFHKDEFEKLYHIKGGFPAVFIAENETISEIISKREIESCHSAEELKKLVLQKMKGYVQRHHSDI